MVRQRGSTLIEVLVTVVLLAFGLLGVAVFQSKSQVGSVESYQRAQAVILLEDMSARLQANSANAADYVATDIGTGDTRPEDCSGEAAGAARDLCEWSNLLKGAAETDASDKKIGGMIGALGCIEQTQAPNPAKGVCTPGQYRVSVAWQGLHETIAPSLTCGKDKYGTDTNRRVISVQVTSPLLTCI
jgi:type IV pilus assembly protein PilV